MVGIRVLGTLAAEVAGTWPTSAGRGSAPCSRCCSPPGETPSTDRMIEELRRSAPPPRALASLQAYVSNLRRELEPGRSRRTPTRLLVSAPPGYALRPGAEAVDAWRFEQVLTRARGRVHAEPAAVREELGAALGLWRGAAFAEFADEPWAAAESASLAELRLAARESHTAATLRLGRSAEAAVAAEGLTREEPLREEGWLLLALALWADGRQADALAALRRARRGLAEELGLDPGPGLTALEDAILNQRWEVLRRAVPAPEELHPPSSSTGETATPTEPAPEPGPAPAAPDSAPAPLFVGRTAELAALARAAEAARTGPAQVVLVTGEAGAGKSAC